MQGTIKFPDKESASLYTSKNDVKILNLCHIPEAGRLKTLSFAVTNRERVQDILDVGERVDGSSLFSSIEPGKSDIYVQPRLDQAFMDPFSERATLSFLCDYLDEDGGPLEVAPQNILRRAEDRLNATAELQMMALAELEFFITAKLETEPLFLEDPDRNYHESSPFAMFEQVRNEILIRLVTLGIMTKYAHGEVGHIIRDNDGVIMEQHEIELASTKLIDAANAVVIAKWAVRNVCQRRGLSATFIPKISIDHAGTGMHVHLALLKNGRNIVADQQGGLSKTCLEVIGGILRCGSSLPAFGNPTPVSYARFQAHKESPMNICWSARNRLAMIRIPLWWNHLKSERIEHRKTFEYRASDAFASPHLLLAALAVAADYGASHSEESISLAERLRVENAQDGSREFDRLPKSCREAASNLTKNRRIYEANNVFPETFIDRSIEKLKAYNDQYLWKKLLTQPEEFEKVTRKFWHYG